MEVGVVVVVVVIITSVKPEGLEDHVGAILVYSTLLITNHQWPLQVVIATVCTALSSFGQIS